MSLIDAAGQKATINDDYFTRHEARGFGREKNRGATQLFHLPESLHWCAQEEFFAALRFVKQLLIQRRAKYAGRDRVYINAVRRPFNGQRFCQHGDGFLARLVRRDLIQRYE